MCVYMCVRQRGRKIPVDQLEFHLSRLQLARESQDSLNYMCNDVFDLTFIIKSLNIYMCMCIYMYM